MTFPMYGHVVCDQCRERSPSGSYDDLRRWTYHHSGHAQRYIHEPIRRPPIRSEEYAVTLPDEAPSRSPSQPATIDPAPAKPDH
jgi:hypothetical protein